jgi:hypothetical protein
LKELKRDREIMRLKYGNSGLKQIKEYGELERRGKTYGMQNLFEPLRKTRNQSSETHR